jgi:hypothetical protein
MRRCFHLVSTLALGLHRDAGELVQPDLADGTLVKIIAEDAPPNGFVLRRSAVYRADVPPAIAARWFINRLKQASEVANTTRKAALRHWLSEGRAAKLEAPDVMHSPGLANGSFRGAP